MEIPRSIFKAYDIRGLVDEQITEEFSKNLGKAFITLLSKENPGKRLTIAVGRDMRDSSSRFQKALMQGITESGADVKDIGLVSTPAFYFGVGHLECDGGIMVTASHNPEKDNGYKITRHHARPVSGSNGIYDLADIMESDEYLVTDKVGVIEIFNGIPDKFVEMSIAFAGADKIRPFKIVVDPGNGMGAQYLDSFFQKHPQLTCEKLFWDLDGSFPNHESNPFKHENNIVLQEKIKELGADLGIATDGDGDRIFFFDENADMVEPEIVRGLIAQTMLRNNPGAFIGYDIRPGKITEDMILEAGGKPFVTKVGHSLIKEKMIELKSVFSGESSGHFYYKYSTGYYEGPITVAVQLLQELSKKEILMSEFVAPYRKYFQSGEINFKVADKQNAIDKIKQHYEDGELNELDGVSITYPDFWFNVRVSNTESILRLNLEAVDKDTMEKRRDELSALIQSY